MTFGRQYLLPYEQKFKDVYKRQYAQLEDAQPEEEKKLLDYAKINFAAAAAQQQRKNLLINSNSSPLDSYLQFADTQDSNPLVFWQAMTTSSPEPAQMAKNVLAVPISGVGVKKQFNIARDICHYCRHSLSASTIKLVIMVKHYNRLWSQAVSMDNGSENTINAQLARSLDRADEQLATIQAISNDNLNLYEEASMLPPSQPRQRKRQQSTRQTS